MPSARAAQAIGLLLFFPSFLLGVGGPPPAVMADPLRRHRGLAAAGPGQPGDPRAVARHRRRHHSAADDRRDRCRWQRLSPHGVRRCEAAATSTLGNMIERRARVAAPAALALFAVLGVLMTDQPRPAAIVAAAVVTVIGIVLAWRRETGWPLLAGLAVAAGLLVYLGHLQSSNLCWMGLCVIAGWVAFTTATPVALAAWAALAVVPVRRVAAGHRRARMGRLVRRHLLRVDRVHPRQPAATHGGTAAGGTG